MKLILTYLNRNKCRYKHIYITLKENAYAWVVVKVIFKHNV